MDFAPFVEVPKTNFAHSLEEYAEWIDENGDEYTYSFKERAVAQLNQYVWQNWRTRSGPCSNCPYACIDDPMEPDFGGFNFNADIMIVAQDPGGGNEGGGTRQLGEGRAKEDIPPLEMQRGYSVKYERAWSVSENKPLSAKEGPPSSDFDNSTTGTLAKGVAGSDTSLMLRDTYLTNAKKCPEYDINGQDDIWEDTEFDSNDVNDDAFDACQPYLEQEIELIRPQVIVPTGKPAMEAVCSAIGREPFDLNYNDYSKVKSEEDVVVDAQSHPKIVLSRFAGRVGSGHIEAVLNVADSYIN